MSRQRCPEPDCEEQVDKRGLPSHLHHAHGYTYEEATELIHNSSSNGASTGASNAEASRNLDDYDENWLVGLYETMREIREFEQTVDALTDEGEVPGSPHLCIGQEAVAAGVCAALDERDYVGSTWRGHGHLLAKGVDLTAMLTEIAGRETGLNGGRAGTMHMADLSVGAIGQNGIVGASGAHVAGGALAADLDGEDRVGAAFFSDGALNEGIVPETMNLAAIWDLPVLFVCENNQYAVSTSVEYSVANHESIPERAKAMGIPGQTIDGQDVLAVYDAAKAAVDRAREGEGPSFIECQTYRYSGHFAAEESLLGDRSYRSEEEESAWRERDPLDNFASTLEDAEILSRDERETIDERVESSLDDALDQVHESERPPSDRAFDSVYTDQRYPNLPSEGYR